MAVDYLLLLAMLLIAADLAYVEAQFRWLGSQLGVSPARRVDPLLRRGVPVRLARGADSGAHVLRRLARSRGRNAASGRWRNPERPASCAPTRSAAAPVPRGRSHVAAAPAQAAFRAGLRHRRAAAPLRRDGHGGLGRADRAAGSSGSPCSPSPRSSSPFCPIACAGRSTSASRSRPSTSRECGRSAKSPTTGRAPSSLAGWSVLALVVLIRATRRMRRET